MGVNRTYQRVLVLATAAFLVSSCGSKGLDEPLPSTKRHFEVSAPWRDGGSIPRRYTCDAANTAPKVSAAFSGRKADQATVMTDPDAPDGTFVHWTTWGRGIEGENSFGKTGYRGPCPPKGDEPHRYVITVYALSRPLGLNAGAKPDDVVEAIGSRTVASGSITGTFGR